jgi:hypothetical protein
MAAWLGLGEGARKGSDGENARAGISTPARERLVILVILSGASVYYGPWRGHIRKIHVCHSRAGIISLERSLERAWHARIRRNRERDDAADLGARARDARFGEGQAHGADDSTGDGEGRRSANYRATRAQERNRPRARGGCTAF